MRKPKSAKANNSLVHTNASVQHLLLYQFHWVSHCCSSCLLPSSYSTCLQLHGPHSFILSGFDLISSVTPPLPSVPNVSVYLYPEICHITPVSICGPYSPLDWGLLRSDSSRFSVTIIGLSTQWYQVMLWKRGREDRRKGKWEMGPSERAAYDNKECSSSSWLHLPDAFLNLS